MTITVILIVILFSFIIVHHIYKVKDKLDEQLKDLRYYQNHISQSLNRIEQSLYQIDAIVSDIEDEIKKESKVMTRKEEIENKAVNDQRVLMESMDWRAGFISGANWADKHPKRYNQDELCDIQLEMMRQRDKRLIKKVCEWIKENIDIYAKVVINHKSNHPEIVMCDTFEKNFIKAMEE